MMVSPFHHITWFSLLMFECTFTGLEATATDVCQNDDNNSHDLIILNETENPSLINKIVGERNFTCLFYPPTHEVNCSWLFQALGMEAKFTAHISICAHEETVQTQESKVLVGSYSSHIEKNLTHLILHFNITLHDQWALYYFKYDCQSLEVLSPPLNVQVGFENNSLLVTWDKPSCLCTEPDILTQIVEYELRISDQENIGVDIVKGQVYFTKLNVDITQSYTVTVRTRLNPDSISLTESHWSDWSRPGTIQGSVEQLNAEVIIAISLGIPMIILAILLVVCQRLSKRLFPPIPSPSPRYLNVLQNNDHFVSPNMALNADEEITIVFYSDNEKAH